MVNKEFNNNLSQMFIERLVLVFNNISNSAIQNARKAFIDFVGVGIGGSKALTQNFRKDLIKAKGEYPILGAYEKLDIYSSIFWNSFAAHILELDDGHRGAMMHLGAPIFPSLLASSLQLKKCSFNDFLKSSVVGYEAAIKIALAIQPSHKKGGFHATGTCGTIGAAMANAFLLDYNDKEKKNVLSAASTSASGLLEMIMGKSEMKPYNVAQACVSGYMSSIYGKSLEGPEDPLGGERGFLRNFSREPNLNFIGVNADELEIQKIYFKPYAACRHCHAPIESALNVAKQVDIEKIERIQIDTYGLAVYGHEHKEVDSINSAKMSIPYGVAAALVYKKADSSIFTKEHINDKIIYDLMKKIEVVEDPSLSELVPKKRSAILKIWGKDGEYMENRIDYPLGEPENPIQKEDLERKFVSLLNFAGYSEKKAKDLFNELNDCTLDIPMREITNKIFK